MDKNKTGDNMLTKAQKEAIDQFEAEQEAQKKRGIENRC